MVCCSVDGCQLLVDLNDHIGYQSFINGSFDSTVLLVASALNVGESDIILDIGANIGTTSIPVAKRFGCEVIAFEASPAIASTLLKNISMNDVRVDVRVVCLVDPPTWNPPSWRTFYRDNGNSGVGSVLGNWNPSKARTTETVRTGSLDTVLAEIRLDRIKLVKIDVEGSEREILKNSRLLNECSAPILFEYRKDLLDKTGDGEGEALLRLISKTHDVFDLRVIGDNLLIHNFSGGGSSDLLVALKNSQEHPGFTLVK
jgi:FkbM family methyltransferase